MTSLGAVFEEGTLYTTSLEDSCGLTEEALEV